MLDQETMEKLKQGNISKDFEKTKIRVKEIWSPLKRPVREEILEIADLKQPTVERTYKTGSLSVKLVVAISQILKINPYYLTGQSDEKQGFDEAILIRFLQELGYKVDSPEVEEVEEDTDEDMDNMEEDTEDTEDTDEVASFQEIFLDEPILALSIMSEDLFEGMTEEEKCKYESISEEQVSALLKGLMISAEISPDKKSIFNLMKYMLTN